jgi:microcystin-dependent protein
MTPMPDAVDAIAQAITDAAGRGAELRIGVVTALESSGLGRCQLDITGTLWCGLDSDARVAVGDRVYAFVQDRVVVVGGRLNGSGAGRVPVGAVTMWAGSSLALPAGWLLCDGSSLSRTAYASLYAVIGTTYGTPSSTTFALPSMDNRVPLAAGTRARGATGGSETVTLTDAQMPSHTHTFTGAAHNHTQDPHTHSVPVSGSVTQASGTGSTAGDNVAGTTGSTTATNNSATATGTNSTSGSDASHTNMQPWFGIYFIVRAL